MRIISPKQGNTLNTCSNDVRRKTGKAWEHSSHEWTRGGCREEGLIFKYIHTKLESEFLAGQDE